MFGHGINEPCVGVVVEVEAGIGNIRKVCSIHYAGENKTYTFGAGLTVGMDSITHINDSVCTFFANTEAGGHLEGFIY